MESDLSRQAWRSALPVLVLDAQAIGSIAVIRSLGRAGYPVHAASSDVNALGLHSRMAKFRAVHPQYADRPAFIAWLKEYVRQHAIRAIVPSEGAFVAIRDVFSEFASLIPFSARPEVLYAGLSKFDLFKRLMAQAETSRFLPPSLLIDDSSRLPGRSELESLGAPLFIKLDAIYAKDNAGGGTYQIESAEAACAELKKFAGSHRKMLVQGHVPGEGVAAFFLLWNGELIAEFMHRRIHEVPHTGGVSSLRESWFHQAIRDDALAKLRRMQWQGVAMMEYRWDRKTDKAYLMEMNGRFWGSLHLALYAGVDFPCLLLDSFHGGGVMPATNYTKGLRCRYTFPKDVHYVWSRLKDKGLPTNAKMWSVLEFFVLLCDPRVKSDLYFPGDRSLYLRSIRRFLQTL
jgi:predicted ATP-grasp superfamily ATP-dependent carboligase